MNIFLLLLKKRTDYSDADLQWFYSQILASYRFLDFELPEDIATNDEIEQAMNGLEEIFSFTEPSLTEGVYTPDELRSIVKSLDISINIDQNFFANVYFIGHLESLSILEKIQDLYPEIIRSYQSNPDMNIRDRVELLDWNGNQIFLEKFATGVIERVIENPDDTEFKIGSTTKTILRCLDSNDFRLRILRTLADSGYNPSIVFRDFLVKRDGKIVMKKKYHQYLHMIKNLYQTNLKSAGLMPPVYTHLDTSILGVRHNIKPFRYKRAVDKYGDKTIEYLLHSRNAEILEYCRQFSILAHISAVSISDVVLIINKNLPSVYEVSKTPQQVSKEKTIRSSAIRNFLMRFLDRTIKQESLTEAVWNNVFEPATIFHNTDLDTNNAINELVDIPNLHEFQYDIEDLIHYASFRKTVGTYHIRDHVFLINNNITDFSPIFQADKIVRPVRRLEFMVEFIKIRLKSELAHGMSFCGYSAEVQLFPLSQEQKAEEEMELQDAYRNLCNLFLAVRILNMEMGDPKNSSLPGKIDKLEISYLVEENEDIGTENGEDENKNRVLAEPKMIISIKPRDENESRNNNSLIRSQLINLIKRINHNYKRLIDQYFYTHTKTQLDNRLQASMNPDRESISVGSLSIECKVTEGS